MSSASATANSASFGGGVAGDSSGASGGGDKDKEKEKDKGKEKEKLSSSSSAASWLGMGLRNFTGLEECLRMFTAVEVLDGENMVGCRRCWKIQNGVYKSSGMRYEEGEDSDREEEAEEEGEGEREKDKGSEEQREVVGGEEVPGGIHPSDSATPKSKNKPRPALHVTAAPHTVYDQQQQLRSGGGDAHPHFCFDPHCAFLLEQHRQHERRCGC